MSRSMALCGLSITITDSKWYNCSEVIQRYESKSISLEFGVPIKCDAVKQLQRIPHSWNRSITHSHTHIQNLNGIMNKYNEFAKTILYNDIIHIQITERKLKLQYYRINFNYKYEQHNKWNVYKTKPKHTTKGMAWNEYNVQIFNLNMYIIIIVIHLTHSPHIQKQIATIIK